MPAVTRIGIDFSAGHCFPSRPADSAGQSTVTINNVLATVVGAHYPAHACLTGDTKINFDGHYIEIGKLIDISYFGITLSRLSCGKIIKSKIEKIFFTKMTKELIEIEIETGKILRCTPDHLIQLQDGSYKEARFINEKDEL